MRRKIMDVVEMARLMRRKRIPMNLVMAFVGLEEEGEVSEGMMKAWEYLLVEGDDSHVLEICNLIVTMSKTLILRRSNEELKKRFELTLDKMEELISEDDDEGGVVPDFLPEDDELFE